MNELMTIENKETITSREVAELTGKEHRSVMRDIRVILEQGVGQSNFVQSSYTNSQNKKQPMYTMTKKGALILASGYDALLREKIINRLEELENKKGLPQDYLSALKALVASEEALVEQQKQLEHQRPLVEFAETVTKTANSISVGEFAKLVADEKINIGQNKLFVWFRENKYLMKNNVPYQRYIDDGYFNLVEQVYKTPYGSKTRVKTLVTGKGQVYFVEKLRKN